MEPPTEANAASALLELAAALLDARSVAEVDALAAAAARPFSDRASNSVTLARIGALADKARQRAAHEAASARERQQLAQYQQVFESIEEAYYEVDLGGRHLLLNPAFSRMLGYSHAEMAGRTNRDFQSPEMAREVQRVFSDVYRTGLPANGQHWRYLHRDGGIVAVEGSVQLVRDGAGVATGFRGIFRDVSARLRVEQALRESEERYRTIIETMQDGYFETDLRGHCLWSNPALYQMTGYAPVEVTGQQVRDRQTPAMAAKSTEIFHQVYESGQPSHNSQWDFVHKDGSTVRVEASVLLVRDSAGAPVGFRAIIRDITERHREARLLALEHRVALGLAESQSSRQGAQMVIRHICESEQWEAGGFWALAEEEGSFRLDTGWATTPAVREFYLARARTMTLDADSGIEAILASGKSRWVRDVRSESTFDSQLGTHLMSDLSQAAILYVPALAGGKLAGLMTFYTTGAVEPDRRMLQTADLIGSHVGQFLQRKQAERVLADSEQRFRALTNLSSDWFWEQDQDLRFTRLETGHADRDEVIELLRGRCIWEAGFDVHCEGGWEAFRELVASGGAFREVVMQRVLSGGVEYFISMSGEPVYDHKHQVCGYRGICREITDQKIAEKQIRYLATHDALTGLPNRVMFSQLLATALALAQRYARGFAVLFIDLDRFKFINDTLGHEAGDLLLQTVSARFRDCLRASDVIGRLGGDEFVVLLQELETEEQAAAAARNLLNEAMRPVILANQDCRITASIGIALYPAHGADEETLMKNADVAMYQAKEEGKNNYQFYSPDVNTQSLEHMVLESNLRQALERNELSLHYQAKVDLVSGAISGVEALLRWDSEALGSISPATFIPVAEEIGVIVPIGKWVLRTACEQIVAWQREGLPSICIAVNLSVRQFADPALLHDIAAIVSETGIDPALLELEITEGMVIRDPVHAAALLAAIKRMGVRLAIDDFGTGYSSLGQLKNFPIDTLKVDRSFIRDVATNAEDRAITQAIIAMAKTLGLTVVAEGVENAEQEDFLRAQCCDQMQGFFFSKPIPAEAFRELLRRHVPRGALALLA